MRVLEVMSRPAITCRSTDTLSTAAKLMWDHDCGVVPVVDDDGCVSGVVTDRDACMAAYIQGMPLDAIAIHTAMAQPVVSCHEDDDIKAVEKLMQDQQIRRVPVVDADNRPVGVVSLNDIARFAAAGTSNGLDREVAQTLAAISEPRQLARD